MLSPWLYPELIYRWSHLFDRQQKVVGVLFGFVEQVSGRGSLLFWLPLSLLPRSWLATFRINWQLLQPAVSVVGVEDCDANKLAQQNQQQQQQYFQQRQQHHQQQRIKSKSIFIEQVREHVERGQQMSWQDVRDEANVIIAAVSREIHMNEFAEIEIESRS